MKTFIRSVLLAAVALALAPSASAVTTTFDVPDGGSSIAMVTLALAGLGALRKYRR